MAAKVMKQVSVIYKKIAVVLPFSATFSAFQPLL
jgi:hypothetical protein